MLETTSGTQAALRYNARGGLKIPGHGGSRRWIWDLSDIYSSAWPSDETANTRIKLIGIASAAGKRANPAYLSGIRLPR